MITPAYKKKSTDYSFNKSQILFTKTVCGVKMNANNLIFSTYQLSVFLSSYLSDIFVRAGRTSFLFQKSLTPIFINMNDCLVGSESILHVLHSNWAFNFQYGCQAPLPCLLELSFCPTHQALAITIEFIIEPISLVRV